MNPATTAPHRCHPVGSFRISAPRIVAKMGTVNWIVVDSASGSSITVVNMNAIEVRPIAVRKTWLPIRFVRNVATPGPAITAMTTTGNANN